MTHAINSNTSLLSIDYITIMHTHKRKIPRREKESRKEMRRDREKNKKKEEIKELKRKKERRKKSIIK